MHWIIASYILLLVLKPFLVYKYIILSEYLLSLCRLLLVFNFRYVTVASDSIGLLILKQSVFQK